jgi:prophage regulatory protein
VSHPSQSPLRRIIAAPQVLHLTALSRTTLWRQVRSGSFPAPVRLTPGRIGWFADEITAFLDSRLRTHHTSVEA